MRHSAGVAARAVAARERRRVNLMVMKRMYRLSVHSQVYYGGHTCIFMICLNYIIVGSPEDAAIIVH